MWDAILFFVLVVGGVILLNKLFPKIDGRGG
jgi:hypothetical protein